MSSERLVGDKKIPIFWRLCPANGTTVTRVAASPREVTSVPLAIVENTLFPAALVGQRDHGDKDGRVTPRANECSVGDRQKHSIPRGFGRPARPRGQG